MILGFVQKQITPRESKWKWKCWSLSCFWLFATPWTVACQAPLSVELSRQEYWSGLPFPSSGNFPDSGIKYGSPALQEDSYCLNYQGSPEGEGTDKIFDFICKDYCIYNLSVLTHVPRGTRKKPRQMKICLGLPHGLPHVSSHSQCRAA